MQQEKQQQFILVTEISNGQPITSIILLAAQNFINDLASEKIHARFSPQLVLTPYGAIFILTAVISGPKAVVGGMTALNPTAPDDEDIIWSVTRQSHMNVTIKTSYDSESEHSVSIPIAHVHDEIRKWLLTARDHNAKADTFDFVAAQQYYLKLRDTTPPTIKRKRK